MMIESNCKNKNNEPTRCYIHHSLWVPQVGENYCELAKAVKKYGSHLDSCVVMNRWHNNDGTKCNCGFRDIVGGNDGENTCSYCGAEDHDQGPTCPVVIGALNGT